MELTLTLDTLVQILGFVFLCGIAWWRLKSVEQQTRQLDGHMSSLGESVAELARAINDLKTEVAAIRDHHEREINALKERVRILEPGE